MITAQKNDNHNRKQNLLNSKIKSIKAELSSTKAQTSKEKIVVKQYIEEIRNRAITQAFFTNDKDIVNRTEKQIQHLMSTHNITEEEIKQEDYNNYNLENDSSGDYEEKIKEEEQEKEEIDNNINKQQLTQKEQEIKQKNKERREKLKEKAVNRRKEFLNRKNKQNNHLHYDEYILDKEFENKKNILVKKIKQAREEASKTKNKEIINKMEQEIKKLLLKNHITADNFYKSINELTKKEKQQQWKDFETKYIDNQQQRYLADEIYKIKIKTIESEEQEVIKATERRVEKFLAKYNRKNNKNITEDDLKYNIDNKLIKKYLKEEIEKMRNNALSSRDKKVIKMIERKIKLMIAWYGVGEENNLYNENDNELLKILPTGNKLNSLDIQLQKLSIIKEIERLRILSFDSGKIEEVKIVAEQIKTLMLKYNIKEDALQEDNNITSQILTIQKNIEQNGTTDEEVVEANSKIIKFMEESSKEQKTNIKQIIENMRAKALYIGRIEYIEETEKKIQQILLNKNLTEQDLIKKQ